MWLVYNQLCTIRSFLIELPYDSGQLDIDTIS